MYPIYAAGEKAEQAENDDMTHGVDPNPEDELDEDEDDDEEEEETTQTVKVVMTVTAPPGTSMADIEAVIRGALQDESIEVDSMDTEQVAS